MVPLNCDPHEVQKIKDELQRNPLNSGVGILHEPSGHISLAPFDDVPGGHAELVQRLNLPQAECKGFAITLQPDGTATAVNQSHLNGTQGNPGSLQMPPSTFAAIMQALKDAGL
jgi:hypothetical protein